MHPDHSHRVIYPDSERPAVRKGVVNSFNDSASSCKSSQKLCFCYHPWSRLPKRLEFCLTLLYSKRFRNAAATILL